MIRLCLLILFAFLLGRFDALRTQKCSHERSTQSFLKHSKSDEPVSTRDKTKVDIGTRAVGVVAALASSLVTHSTGAKAASASPSEPTNLVTLQPLPYAYDALEKHGISEKTLRVHHGKHHAKYVSTTQDMIKGTKLEGKDLKTIILNSHKSNQGLFNNAAQAFNHEFYWNCMKPNGGGGACPKGPLADAINESFGSHEEFRKQFAQAGNTLFGSGWVWLAQSGANNPRKLEIIKTSNADVPMVDGKKVLLTMDVWEHAYYLDKQNERNKYIDSFLDNLVNWDFVQSQFDA